MVSNSRADCIDRGVRHDPCGPCSVRGVSWIPRERSRWDVTLIGRSLVSQDGRKEQSCVKRLIPDGLSACLKANEIHQRFAYLALKHGMTYVRQSQEEYEAQMREKQIKALRRKARQLGLEVIERTSSGVATAVTAPVEG